MIGRTLIIIHSGLLIILVLAALSASTTFKRLRASVLLCLDDSLCALCLKSNDKESRSILFNNSSTASAPILATNLLGSESSRYWFSIGSVSKTSRYSSSVRNSLSSKSEPSAFLAIPCWITTYLS